MTPLERRCRLLLKAWPWRDRWERGDELLGTMLDVIGDDREWPPPRLTLDMVIGGVKARRRRRPPLSIRLRFFQGGRLEYRWHEWMLDRLLAPGWRRRLVLSDALRLFLTRFGILLVVSSVTTPPPLIVPLFTVFTGVELLIEGVRAERVRTTVLRHHGYALEGSPPQVVSHLVWAEKQSTAVNVRLAPAMVAASVPLLGAGALPLIDRSISSNVPAFTWQHLPLLAILLAVLAQLAAFGIRAFRVPASAGRPTGWSGQVSVLTVALLVAIEACLFSELPSRFLSELTSGSVNEFPSGAFGFAGGVIGIATSVLASALLLNERRIGRPIGLWDLYPRLGPGTAPVVEAPLWWAWDRAPIDGDGQTTV